MKKISLTLSYIIITLALLGGITARASSTGQGMSQLSTFAGNGEFTREDGPALSASFRMPYSIVTLPDGTILVSDSSNQIIRSIHNNEINTYAGITFENDDYGIPQGGWSDGAKELAVFHKPSGMTADEEGNVYIADAEYNLIRKISADGQVTTIAGNGFRGRKDGYGPTARFYYPQDIAIAKDGTLYVADTLNHTIRKITKEGMVSTLNARSTRTVEVEGGSIEWAGDYRDGKIKHAKFNEPSGLAIDSKGNLYVSDTGNQLIRYIDFLNNTVTTVAGNINHSSSISKSNAMYATGGYSDGIASKASFNFPKGLSVTEENGVIIADSLNHSIRYLLDGNVYTLAENFHNPTDVAIMQDGSILIADSYNNLVSQLEGYTPYIKLTDDDHTAEAGTDEAVDSPTTTDIPREAHIEEVIGVVYIRRGGGAKEFRAFNGINLSNGDHIRTEAYSSVILGIPDTGDQITVDQNAQIYISDLRNEASSSKITKLIIWSGSIWVNASTLENTDDKFEIETTTAVLNIRGTTLLVGVDPETGESKFFIASGAGRVNKKSDDNSGSGTTLTPNQQITLDSDSDQDDYDDYSNIADLNDLISNTSNAIIEAILANKAAIDQENQEYIDRLREEQQNGSNNQEAIDRINQNLDNLVGNIVKNAISQNKVDETAIKALIDKINESLDRKLDLSDVKAPELTDQEKAKQKQIELLDEKRKKKQEEQKLKQEELKKQNEELQKKLKEQLEKQKKEKEKAAEAAKKKAAEEFAKRLADEVARQAFEAKQKALEEAKAEQDKARQAANQPSISPPTPAPTPAPAPVPELLSVTSVMDFEEIVVLYGAVVDELGLPQTVTITLSDNSEVEVPVNWSDINVYLVGTQIITGTLDISNFVNVKATELTATIEVRVYISEEDILAAAEIDNEIIALPDVSLLTLSDADIVVAAREGYDNLTPFQQSLVTKLDILESAEAMIIELEAAVPDVLLVTSVMDFEEIVVLYGAVVDELGLPQTVTITLSDNSEVEVPVNWSDINVYLVGTQSIIGMLDLSDILNVAATELTATIEARVYISEEDILAATEIDNKIIALLDVSLLTLSNADIVVAAREGYDNLTPFQQSLVTKLDILESAEAMINELEAA